MKNYLRVSGITASCLLVALSSFAGQTADYDALIEEIAERPEVQKAFDIIVELEPQTEKDLIEITEIPAPPFQEEVRGVRYAEMMQEAGLSTETDAVGNVLARRSGTVGSRTVAVVAHLDTVFPEGTDVTIRWDGDRMLAPGVGDDSRGLALVLAVVKAMNLAKIETRDDVLFVASVGEEGLGDLRGVKHLLRDGGPRVDEFIAVDGGGADRVLYHAIGSHRYRVTFKGPGGHSWGAFGRANTAHALSRAVYLFDEAAAEYVIGGPKTTYNIGRIGGGTSVNSIPFANWMEVDMRSETPENLEEIDAIFQKAMQQALEQQNERRLEGEALSVEVELIGDRPSGKADVDSPLIQKALAATRYFGLEPTLSSGSTDSNVPISMGIPSTTIGRGGDGADAHALTEWWANRDGHLGIQKALLLILAAAGVADGAS